MVAQNFLIIFFSLFSLPRRRIPPRNLARLAYKYYGNDAEVFAKASSIDLFHPPPKWAFRDSTTTSRKDGRDEKTVVNKELETAKIYPRATVACGNGLGNEIKKKLWRRKRFQMTAIGVGIAAILCSLWLDRRGLLVTSALNFSRDQVIHNIVVDSKKGECHVEGLQRREHDLASGDGKTFSGDVDSVNNAARVVHVMADLDLVEDSTEKNCISTISADVVATEKNEPLTSKSVVPASKLRPVQLVRNLAKTTKSSLANEAEIVFL